MKNRNGLISYPMVRTAWSQKDGAIAPEPSGRSPWTNERRRDNDSTLTLTVLILVSATDLR